MSNHLLKCPPQLRAVQHYLKLAVDYEARQPVITYWARLYSLESALKIDKKSPEARTLLAALMDWLETFKKSTMDDEAINSNIAGQALLENEANKLFVWADSNDRAAVFNKNVVKSFYTTGVLLDVCEVFGELSEEVAAQRKYAKWKATYIHNCLKQGETPLPGPIGGEGDEGLEFDVPTMGEASTSGDTIGHLPSVPPPAAAAPLFPPAAAPDMTPVESSSPAHSSSTQPSASIAPEALKQARKYCKWADSALDYQDITTAVDNLSKAIALLQPYAK